jgi:hypothetical protein
MGPLSLGGGVDCQPEFEVRASFGETSEMDQARADAGVTHLPPTIVVKPLGQCQQLICHRERRALAAAREVAGKLAPDHTDELVGIANFEAKLTSTAKSGIGFHTGVARCSR